MVSSLFRISDFLANRGHDVWVLSDVKAEAEARSGAKWVNGSTPFDTRFDMLICNRGVGDGFDEFTAKRRVLWTHDLPHNGFIPEPKTIKAFAAVVFMSRYAESVWRTFYPDIGYAHLIPNGVDPAVFHPRKKDLSRLIFASAPNRGLKRLPFLFDAISTRVDRPLGMTAYSNLKALHPNEVDPRRDDNEDGFSEIYNQVAESRVELRDPLPQMEFADVLSRAGLMILPSDYPEICSNVILQSLACGTPVITTGNLGSAGEWVKSGRNGFLTHFQPHDYMVYQVEIVRAAVKLLENPDLHHRFTVAAAETDIKSWDEIGERWERLLTRLY